MFAFFVQFLLLHILSGIRKHHNAYPLLTQQSPKNNIYVLADKWVFYYEMGDWSLMYDKNINKNEMGLGLEACSSPPALHLLLITI